MKYFLLIYSLLILPSALFASQDDISKSKGTTQDVIVQLMPSPAQEDVSRYVKISASFNIPLNVKHVKKYDVKLTHICEHKKHEYEKKQKHDKKYEYEKKHKHDKKYEHEKKYKHDKKHEYEKKQKHDKKDDHDKKCKKKIKGRVAYVETENKVTFTPKEALTPGLYEVEFKSLKADKAHKRTKIKKIKYRFIVEEKVLESMTVLPGSIHLIEGETVQLSVTGKYDNGIEKDIMSKVEWVVGDTQTISVDDNGLATALKAGNTTIKAKLTDVVEAGEIVSNDVPVEVLIPDVVPPVITLNGEKTITLHQDAIYEELGAVAIDERDGDVNVTITGTVDTSIVGNYTITYSATDSVGNEANITRSVTVIDVTPPVLTLNGEANMTLEQNANYSELGARALDAVDGNISVIITGTVNTSTVGNYTVTYAAQDSVGNEANITRSVTVIDAIPPIIILNGDENISLSVGESYEELGASAADVVDGNVSVTITGNVDTSMVGTYTITYTAQDSIGNEATATRTVTVVAPILRSISLESNVTTLNVGETAELTVIATYSDGSSEELNENLEFIITPSAYVDVNDSVITAKKDGNVTVEAKVNNVLSNTLNLTIAWVVNGHVLPPEPDPVLNNSTLLGIDVNNNNVRDDVERWIYEEYKDKHPIHIDIAMQAGRAYKLVLETPEKAKEIHNVVSAPIFCGWYYQNDAKYFNEPILVYERIDSNVFNKFFNTKERKATHRVYDTLLSGDSYLMPKTSTRKSLCDFNTSKYTE